jgi:ATP-binding protein involved in chromosome partitioning
MDDKAVLSALATIKDPDLNRDIVSLGFIKDLSLSGSRVSFKLELTTPACPVKDALKTQCEDALKAIGFSQVDVTLSAQTRGQVRPETPSTGLIRNMIAIASGKGGVGKSTTALQVAKSFKRQGARVGLLDADIYGPSQMLMTKAGQPTAGPNSMMVPPLWNGIKVISVGMFQSKANILRGPMTAQIIKQFLTQVDWGELDYLIIDYPPGTGDIQLTVSQLVPLSGAVLVTTPQEVARIDVLKACEMFQTLKVPILGFIENMSYFTCDQCDKKHRFFGEGAAKKLADEFSSTVLAEIPLSNTLAIECDKGVFDNTDTSNNALFDRATSMIASHLSTLHMQKANVLDNFSLEWRA